MGTVCVGRINYYFFNLKEGKNIIGILCTPKCTNLDPVNYRPVIVWGIYLFTFQHFLVRSKLRASGVDSSKPEPCSGGSHRRADAGVRSDQGVLYPNHHQSAGKKRDLHDRECQLKETNTW